MTVPATQITVMRLLVERPLTSQEITQRLSHMERQVVSDALYQAKRRGRVTYDGTFALTDKGRELLEGHKVCVSCERKFAQRHFELLPNGKRRDKCNQCAGYQSTIRYAGCHRAVRVFLSPGVVS